MELKAKLLVVDDEPINIKLLEAILAPEYVVLTALSGQDALKIIDEQDVDMALLDIMMPGMHGLEVTKRLRADPKHSHMPIILITSLKRTEDRIKGQEAGADDYIAKPFDSNEVLARIKILLKRGHSSGKP
jgi:two-component system cell cycle response regulator